MDDWKENWALLKREVQHGLGGLRLLLRTPSAKHSAARLSERLRPRAVSREAEIGWLQAPSYQTSTSAFAGNGTAFSIF